MLRRHRRRQVGRKLSSVSQSKKTYLDEEKLVSDLTIFFFSFALNRKEIFGFEALAEQVSLKTFSY